MSNKTYLKKNVSEKKEHSQRSMVVYTQPYAVESVFGQTTTLSLDPCYNPENK
jgi:hypothetical protein